MGYILAFGSAHKALKAESILKEASVDFRLLPAPKALAAYCDLVISVKEGDLAHAASVLKGAGAGPKTVYKREGDDYVKV